MKQDGRESASGGTYQVRHYLRDHLGSVRTVVDGATGDILETNDFLPFGKRWDLTGGSSTQTLAMAIYGMTKKRVTPEINAVSTLLFVVVLAVLVIVNVREARMEQAEVRRHH